ncbi:hypothetical protein VIGAN_11101300 [Vigna angularis var. angularis]|uniref:Uncharacterized protein n=1 Tax=Vigna angularis var. angularis TaxID=157739 RepID=A0A0S3T952_PHAAN|nr:hypothetical protein VIGAN_11101300 [Vigna angularis var. angularis]
MSASSLAHHLPNPSHHLPPLSSHHAPLEGHYETLNLIAQHQHLHLRVSSQIRPPRGHHQRRHQHCSSSPNRKKHAATKTFPTSTSSNHLHLPP